MKNKDSLFILRLSPEGYEYLMQAGLLACPVFEQPSHSEISKQWQRMCQKPVKGLTATGIAPDFSF